MDNWDENVRRQYQYKCPHIRHPYGEDEEPERFRNFHIFTKIRVLHQLTVIAFYNPDKIRSAYPDVKEAEQFDYWVRVHKPSPSSRANIKQQVHPVGWDRHDRTYYKFAGERLYRRTDPPIPEPVKTKAKYTSKKAQAQRRRERASKRRKVVESDDNDTEMGDVDETLNDSLLDDENVQTPIEEDPEKINTFGDYKFECVAVSLDDYKSFIATMEKSRDANEQNLKDFIKTDILSALEAQEEKRQRKIEARQREVVMAERMLGAKRSGRLAAKQEREREEAEAAEEEARREAIRAEARKEEDRLKKMENDRQSRIMTRERRIMEREIKRVQMEDQLAQEEEEAKKIEEGGARESRHLKERIEKRKKELEKFEDDEWTFDCSGCGQHGKNFDDGEHSIACERCNVWQHSKCLGFSKAAAESDDFHFICRDCRRKEEEANRPKISLKFKVGSSSSPPQPTSSSPNLLKQEQPVRQKLVSVDVPPVNGPNRPSAPGVVVNGQFYPAPNPTNETPSLPQPPHSPQASQPTMPAYAMKNVQRAMPYVNGVGPYSYNTFNAYPPQDRLPGSAHAQNLYNQITHPNATPQYHNQPTNPYPPVYAQSPVRPASSHSQTPRPHSNHSQANGHSSPIRQRIPSPVLNPPTMSPTQGNPDVGPIAGVPGSSPILQPASISNTYTNGHHTNGNLPQSTPTHRILSRNPSFSASQTGTTQPLSGLSPTKTRLSASPLPQPTLVPQKQSGAYTTPSSSFNNAQTMRSVSGTPIFPPAENLAPSPQQLNREPVPTPSKHSPPLTQGPIQSQGFRPSLPPHSSSFSNSHEEDDKHSQQAPQLEQEKQSGTVQ